MSNRNFSERTIRRNASSKARLLVLAISFLSLLAAVSLVDPYKSGAQQPVAETWGPAELPIISKGNAEQTRPSDLSRTAGQSINVSPAATRTVDTTADNPSLT